MFLGIDIGTSKVAAVIADDAGAVPAAGQGGLTPGRPAVVSLPHVADLQAAPPRAEQDATALLDAAWAAVQDLPADLRRQVRAVGVTGQMHGMVLVDAHGAAYSPLITWQDGRAAEAGFLDGLRSRTGYQLSTGYGCATLAWLVRHGVMPPEAIGAATIHDLAVARLSGLARPVTDPTDAASWGLFDLASLAWDGAAVAAAGIPPRLLPEVRPCGSRAGALRAEMAARLGLPAGIPVAVAIGDNQASLLATLRQPEKELALTLGTGGQVSAVLAAGAAIDWCKAPGPYEYRPYPGGRYAVVAASLCGGAAWAWLADSIGRWMSDLGVVAPDRDELFAMLNVLGLESPDIVEVRPHFLGERHRPDLRGSIEGLTLGNFTLGAVAKGLARGILTNLRDMLPQEVLMGPALALPSKAGLRRGGSATGLRRERVVASGNALRHNPLLQRAAEEVFGLPLVLTDGREEAALGAARLASELCEAR